jgi:hypothetical protein
VVYSKNRANVCRGFGPMPFVQTERKLVANWFNLSSLLNGYWALHSIEQRRKNGRGICGAPEQEVGTAESHNTPAKRLARIKLL